ncbi:MAG: ribonuclease Y [Culicoidibacterales bacterium]
MDVFTIVISLLGLLFGTICGGFITRTLIYKKLEIAKNNAKQIILNAENEAKLESKKLIQEAKVESQVLVQEAKEQAQEQKENAKAIENRAIEMEKGITKFSELLEKREFQLEKKENELQEKTDLIKEQHDQVNNMIEEQKERLYRVANLSPEDAKSELFRNLEHEFQTEIDILLKQKQQAAEKNIDIHAKALLVQAMERYSSDVTTERNVAVVQLLSDDVKGKIIGREGRNIRTFEALTGADVIIDDTPEAVVISCFDPIRREIAKRALEQLVLDGRIHPTRIEELVNKSKAEVERFIVDKGETIIDELGIGEVSSMLIEALGKLHFRTSYGQNILRHSIEVSHLCGMMASELGLDVRMAKRAGLFHDIGKAIDFEQEGSHVDLGVELATSAHEPEIVINSIASHHGDVEATSIIASLVAIADTLSAARTGARNESLEFYIQRLKDLEAIANDNDGVENSFAIQAGRELRVIVQPEVMSDAETLRLAKTIRERIEAEMQYPGTVKITVVREMRAIEIAK